MPQTRAADAQAPASATPAPGQPVATTAPTAPIGPISPEQAEFLRAKRSALSNQLESVQGRRDEVAEQLRDAETQASERPGLESRLRVLDERLIQIEKDMATNSAELANAPARSRDYTQAAQGGGGDRGFLGRVNPNLITIFSFALLMPLAIQFARRVFGPRSARFDRQQQAEAAAVRERMDKMENALEAVAIEVERIGEGQRFLTQAMTDPVSRANVGGAGAPVFEPVRMRERDPAELR